MAQLPSLLDATLEDLTDGLAKGHFTSVELVKAYLARIEQVNGTVRAVTEINKEALHIAGTLDEQRKKGHIQGCLHGIPVLVKNNIAAFGMDNTAGSSLLISAGIPLEAHVVRNLCAEGAIILGKANLSQWANWRTQSISITGWSADGGQTLAAYHPNQSAGGSSSGSGVAVDLGLAWAALGTETDGSILDPASRNGIVGIKPTVGLTSRSGVIPISEHFDTVGPMARTVRDAASILQIIAGMDPRDSYTSKIPYKAEYMYDCDFPDPFIGARIGVPWNVIDQALDKKSWMSAEIEAFKIALSVLEDAGVKIEEVNFTATMAELRQMEKEILNADFPINLASYLSQVKPNPNNIHTLADVRAQTRNSAPEGWPKLDTEMWDEILDREEEEGPSLTTPQEGNKNKDKDEISQDIEAAFERLQDLGIQGGPIGAIVKHNLTAIAMPTSLTETWAAVGGGPGITVPMGQYPDSTPVLYKQGRPDLLDIGPAVPFGICFLGKKWSEGRLIQLANGYEQRTRFREKAKRIIEPNRELERETMRI